MTLNELLTIEPPCYTQEKAKPTTWYVSVKNGGDLWITFDIEGKAIYRKGLKYTSDKEPIMFLDEIKDYAVEKTTVKGNCQNIYLIKKGRYKNH